MTMKKSGLAHLCHHNRHYEFCYDFDERVEYIKRNKPKAERPTRLKYFQIMPEDRLPKGEEWDVLKKAWDAHNKAWDALNTSDADAHKEAWDVLKKALAALNKAWDAYYARHHVEIDRLHDELFPDCPWNEKQQTMFPEKR